MEVFYESIHLRKLVLISVRIDDINNNELSEMLMSGRRLFVCSSLYNVSVSPSLWCFSIVASHIQNIKTQIWFWLRYKHYGGKKTEASANNNILKKYQVSKLLG